MDYDNSFTKSCFYSSAFAATSEEVPESVDEEKGPEDSVGDINLGNGVDENMESYGLEHHGEKVEEEQSSLNQEEQSKMAVDEGDQDEISHQIDENVCDRPCLIVFFAGLSFHFLNCSGFSKKMFLVFTSRRRRDV